MKRIGIISALLVVMLLVSTSCASGVPQEAYDRVQDELSTIESELATLQGKLAESEALQAQNEELSNIFDTIKGEYEAAQAEYNKLSTEYDGLSAELDELRDNFDDIQSDYEVVQAKYDELSAEYDELIKQSEITEEEEIVVETTEADVEQAVFELVNQNRRDNGLDESIWSDLLHKWAIRNSRDMATKASYEYADYSGWQEIFWAAGYSTADEIASAALIIWKNSPQYELNILNKHANYITVAVYKSGEVYYITYIASTMRG